MTIHFIYKSGDRVSTPFAIGRELACRLARDYDVKCYDPALRETIRPEPGDILIGHPGWDRRTIFQRSVREPGWARRIAIHPFCPDDLDNYAHLAFVVPRCDAFLAITGRVWIDRLPRTLFAAWAGKVTHLDRAVSRAHFPFLRADEVAPEGERRFLFVGNHPAYKNVGFLDQLAAAAPDVAFHRIGPFKRRFRHLTQHGPKDFALPEVASFAAGFDFMITPSERDANPTTILEAMALGLIPVAPEGSGYYAEDGVIPISGRDIAAAVATIRRLQAMPAEEIIARRRENLDRLDRHYTWERFAAVVVSVIEGDGRADFALPLATRLRCAAAHLTSKRSPYALRRLPSRWLRAPRSGGR